jgi:hypothetical protein
MMIGLLLLLVLQPRRKFAMPSDFPMEQWEMPSLSALKITGDVAPPRLGNGLPPRWGWQLTPRQNKASIPNTPESSFPRESSGSPPPIIPSGTQNHDFIAQAVHEINRTLGKLDSGFSSLDSRLSRVETKLDSINNDVVAAKATFGTLKWVFGIVGSLCALLLAAVLTVLINHFSKH